MLPAKQSANRADNDVFAQYESNVQSYARAFPQIFTRALGSEMWDVNGRRYLDFLSGAGSLNFGHNNPVIKQVASKYLITSRSNQITLNSKAVPAPAKPNAKKETK